MSLKIAVVIPCYKVSRHVLSLISKIGSEVSIIIAVDDACPEGSGDLIQQNCKDHRVKLIRHENNMGVGGAVCSGYALALDLGADIVVKLDGDGQMDPSLINQFIEPLIEGRADYTKGNRFYSLELVSKMPAVRIFGNSVLSFVSKVASGYWNIMDPTNGYTAIHRTALSQLPLEKLHTRYFFESDMLFRLNTIRAVVAEVPMKAIYADEESNLKISNTALEFPTLYLNRFFKRIFYSYFLRDFNPCSLELICGVLMLAFGLSFGFWHWGISIFYGKGAATGTIMLAAVSIILGMQFVLAAVNYDMSNIPKEPLQRLFLNTKKAEIVNLRKVVN